MKTFTKLFLLIFVVGSLTSCCEICEKYCCPKEIGIDDGRNIQGENGGGDDISEAETVMVNTSELELKALDAMIKTGTTPSIWYKYGTTAGKFNICRNFIAESSSSRLELVVGKVYDQDTLKPMAGEEYDLADNSAANPPIGVQWKIESSVLKFRIIRLASEVVEDSKYKLAANVDVAMKMTDAFPIFNGVPAIIGSEDGRNSATNKRSVGAWSGIAGGTVAVVYVSRTASTGLYRRSIYSECQRHIIAVFL